MVEGGSWQQRLVSQKHKRINTNGPPHRQQQTHRLAAVERDPRDALRAGDARAVKRQQRRRRAAAAAALKAEQQRDARLGAHGAERGGELCRSARPGDLNMARRALTVVV